MEIKPGYKLTNGRVIPKDWEVKRLGELTDIRSGGTPSTKDTAAWDGSIPWCTPTDITALEGRKYLVSTNKTITEYGLNNSSAELIPAQSILMTSRATIGESAINTIPVATNQGFKNFVPFDFVDAEFLYYLLDIQVQNLVGFSAGSTFLEINKTQLRQCEVDLPATKSEQIAIATTLSDIDALLVELNCLITKKHAIKQNVTQRLITGQIRLPGFDGEWEVRRLEDLADIRGGGTPSTQDAAAWDGEIPWCTPTDITALGGGKYLTTTSRKISEHGLRNSSAELIPARSVVMTSRATIGECAINTVSVATNQGFKNFVPFDFLDVEFLYYLLLTQTQALISLSAGSTFLEVGKKQIGQHEVRLPSTKNEQAAIAAVLSDVDAEIAALEVRRNKTRALKQAMMQELLTGRIRLVAPDAKPAGDEAVHAGGRKANVHFRRSVLAAEIIDQLHDQPTFGHVKFEKLMFLVEHLCAVDTGSTYHRKAAGPYDNRALRSIDSQLQKQQWFEARKEGQRYQYVPLAKRGGHKPYFDRYFSDIAGTLEKILSTFETTKTEQCEIVATLLSAWSDLLHEKGVVSDEMIVHEVLHNWHESKQRIPEHRWLAALDWMRAKGFVPREVAPT